MKTSDRLYSYYAMVSVLKMRNNNRSNQLEIEKTVNSVGPRNASVAEISAALYKPTKFSVSKALQSIWRNSARLGGI